MNTTRHFPLVLPLPAMCCTMKFFASLHHFVCQIFSMLWIPTKIFVHGSFCSNNFFKWKKPITVHCKWSYTCYLVKMYIDLPTTPNAECANAYTLHLTPSACSSPTAHCFIFILLVIRSKDLLNSSIVMSSMTTCLTAPIYHALFLLLLIIIILHSYSPKLFLKKKER